MDYEKALEVLNMNKETNKKNINIETLKRQYYKMALKNHPDKNGNSLIAKEKFQKVNDAYEFLKKNIDRNENEITGLRSDSDSDSDSEQMFDTAKSYESILKTFIFGIRKGEYNEIISTIVSDIVTGCKKISLKLFENLDKAKALEVYSFLSKYKNILHIDQATIDIVREIVLEKSKDDCVYVLNPSIDDLLDNNIYKLEVNKVLYFVPLWHDELYFDGFGCDIIVRCIPELPDNVCIDENNNLFVDIEIPFHMSLFDFDRFSFNIGKKKYNIAISELNLQKIQHVCLKNEGISEIDEKDMYNIEKKSDIHVKITFV